MQGYPQQQTYSQPQAYAQPGYAAYDAQDQMEKAKKAQHARERVERHERKRKAEMANGASLVKWLCLGAFCNAGLLFVPVFGNAWTHKQFVGLGVKMLTIRTSLFMIDVEVECGKNYLEDKLCAMIGKMHGAHSLHQGQAIACAMSSHACTVMDKLYYGSFILFFFYSIALLCDLTAALFLWYYWYGTPLPKIRKFALVSFFLAPISAIFGIMIWTCYIPNLAELPMAWTQMSSMITGTEFFGYKEVNAVPYGWSYIFAWLVNLLLTMQLFVWTCCFIEHRGEDNAEAEEELAKLIIDDPSFFETMPLAVEQAPPYSAQGMGQTTYGAPEQQITYGAPQQQVAYGAAQQQQQQAPFGMPAPAPHQAQTGGLTPAW